MSAKILRLERKKKGVFIDKVKELSPDGGNLNLGLTCWTCSSGCPANGAYARLTQQQEAKIRFGLCTKGDR